MYKLIYLPKTMFAIGRHKNKCFWSQRAPSPIYIYIHTHVPTNTFSAGMVETSMQPSTNNGPMQHLPCDQCSHDPHAPSGVMPHAIWPLHKCKDNMIIYQKQVLENILRERILQEATRPTADSTGRAEQSIQPPNQVSLRFLPTDAQAAREVSLLASFVRRALQLKYCDSNVTRKDILTWKISPRNLLTERNTSLKHTRFTSCLNKCVYDQRAPYQEQVEEDVLLCEQLIL